MKNVLQTNPSNWSALIARLALAVTIFPHGAQKLLGWFGGYGYQGTMGFLTGMAKLPYPVALLVILIEFFGALMLFFGLATRIAALGMIGLFTGVVVTVHGANGFFMNWNGTQKGEGFEYFILLMGLAIVLLIAGGGKLSADAALTSGSRKPAAVR